MKVEPKEIMRLAKAMGEEEKIKLLFKAKFKHNWDVDRELEDWYFGKVKYQSSNGVVSPTRCKSCNSEIGQSTRTISISKGEAIEIAEDLCTRCLTIIRLSDTLECSIETPSITSTLGDTSEDELREEID